MRGRRAKAGTDDPQPLSDGQQRGLASAVFANSQATAAGFVWRDLPTADIGLDGVVEWIPGKEHPRGPRGLVLVQVKTSSTPVRRGILRVRFKKRHHLYWMRQRLPVVLCVVILRRRSAKDRPHYWGRTAYWIDYKNLDDDDRLRWGLRIPLTRRGMRGRLVCETGSSRPARDLRMLRHWLKGVLTTPSEALAELVLRNAEDYTESGQPDRAVEQLDLIRDPDASLLKEAHSFDLALRHAKALRRAGDLDRALALLEEVCQPLKAIRGLDGRRLRHSRSYDAGFVGLLQAMQRPRDTHLWCSCLVLFAMGLGIKPAKGHPPSKDRFIAQTVLVHAKAMRAWLTGQPLHGPSSREIAALAVSVGQWRRTLGRIRRQEGKEGFEDATRRIFNAEMALGRACLVSGRLPDARRILRGVCADFRRSRWHHTFHSILHFVLERAWLEAREGRLVEARGDLATVKLLRNCLGRDLELDTMVRMVTREVHDRAIAM